MYHAVIDRTVSTPAAKPASSDKWSPLATLSLMLGGSAVCWTAIILGVNAIF